MAVGALIGAYQEDESGGLRALLPVTGRTLLEYQVRCAATAGAAPIVVIVERVPQALQDALERLRLDGIGAFAVSDLSDAVSRFEAGSRILIIGDGIVAPAELVVRIAEEPEPAIGIVPDDETHQRFERIDAQSRWAGIALVDANLLGSTAAILGDWDLQSTLLRRSIQEGALRIRVAEAGGDPLLADTAEDLQLFQAQLLADSRGVRSDWVSRYLLPPVDEFATRQLMEAAIRPSWLLLAAVALTLVAAICFLGGWLGAGLLLLLISMPLDIVASRLATLRMRPITTRNLTQRALWPAAGAVVLALGWWEMRHMGGWGALLAAACACAFAEASRIERRGVSSNEMWLVSRRSAIVAAIPFALAGAWTPYLVALLLYAALSFFLVQHVRHEAVS